MNLEFLLMLILGAIVFYYIFLNNGCNFCCNKSYTDEGYSNVFDKYGESCGCGCGPKSECKCDDCEGCDCLVRPLHLEDMGATPTFHRPSTAGPGCGC